MIHDKDYLLRIVRQFSNMLAKLLLDKNEADFIEFQRIFDTQMNDTFKMDFTSLSTKTKEEILEMIDEKDPSHHIPYLELLGNIFYLKGKEFLNKEFLNKSKTFYEHYLHKSQIFSLPIINRLNELKNIL